MQSKLQFGSESPDDSCKLEPTAARRSIFRPAIEHLSPYLPGEQPRQPASVVKLNTNENPYPPSPLVRRRIAEAIKGGQLRLYPPPGADEFVECAAKVYGVARKSILAGNGCDELLSIIFRAVLGRGDRLAYLAPSYTLYDTLAAIQEAQVIRVPYDADPEQALRRLAEIQAELTIVCNPNSPTGAFVSVDKLGELAHRLEPRLLVIDEAYVDFADDNAMRLLGRLDNVIVLRSLSKSFSLAGMRLGLAFSAAPVIETLYKVKDSYNLSRVAIMAGAAALEDIDWMKRNVERVCAERARTENKLRQLGFEVAPSKANFVFARIPGHDLSWLAQGLREKGILVRHFPSPDLRDGLRISIGRPSEMTRLFRALKELLQLHHQRVDERE